MAQCAAPRSANSAPPAGRSRSRALSRSSACRPPRRGRASLGRSRRWGSLARAALLRAAGMDDQEPLHPALRGLKTVCRCNNIKYRTIERAIREGAHTLSQVATRTSATLGQCGGTCTPDVQQMIDELAPKYVTAAPANAAAKDPNAWWVRKK